MRIIPKANEWAAGRVIQAARLYADEAPMASSAWANVDLAEENRKAGRWEDAIFFAMRSLAYSVGIMAHTYRRLADETGIDPMA